VVLICISLMTNGGECIFTCSLAMCIYMSSPWRNVYLKLLPIKIDIFLVNVPL
jgi:hypothetical protein